MPLKMQTSRVQLEITNGEEITTNFRQMKSGPPLTNVDGRIGFLLAFAFSIEVVVKTPFSEEKEVVSAMFCGDANEPLLVQRIGKARREGKETATVGGTERIRVLL